MIEVGFKAIRLLLFMGIIPMILGMWCTHWGKEKDKLILNYISGWLLILAGFEFLCVPMTLLKMPYHLLRTCSHIFFLILTVSAVIGMHRQLIQILKNMIAQIKKIDFWTMIAILAVGAQVMILVFGMHEDADDAFYVATAATTLQTDSMYLVSSYTGMPLHSLPVRYALSAFPIFNAYLSELINIHPTILAHTIFPAIFIPIAYMIYYQIGVELTEEKKKAAFFVVAVSFLNVFGNFSIYSSSSFLLFRIWQGKAILAAILIPAIFLFAFRIYEKQVNRMEWITMFFLICSCCMVTSMGVALAPFVLGAISLVEWIRKKSFRTVWPVVFCVIPAVILGAVYLIL